MSFSKIKLSIFKHRQIHITWLLRYSTLIFLIVKSPKSKLAYSENNVWNSDFKSQKLKIFEKRQVKFIQRSNMLEQGDIDFITWDPKLDALDFVP